MIIFDIDGVLSESTHRLKYISSDKKDWDKFFENCENDNPIAAGCMVAYSFLKTLKYKSDVLFLTGRPEKYRKETLSWLHKYLENDIGNESLIMRENGNHEPDVDFKRRIGEKIGFKNIDLVFEDRDRVVNMWRENGVTCYQTCKGSY